MAVDPERWGIMYTPRAGVRNKMKRWYQIKEYLNLRGVKYDSFQSDGDGSTEVLTKMLINNGYKTIVVVGGDEALNDAVNALMFTPREVRSEIVVGVIPNGIGNDFASFWGLDVENYKQAIHWIIERRVKKIDVGYCSYKEGDEEKVRYFLMSVNIGLGAQAIRLSDICKRFGKKNPSYILAIFALFKERKQYKMRIKVNNEEINDKIMTLCVGNTRGYGLTPSAVPYSGWLDVSVVYRPKLMEMIRGLYMLLHNQLLNHEQVKPYRSKSIVISESDGTITCLDGHTLVHTYPLTISLEPSVMNFIIPG
jgi:diacylglycerol kinase family enzyme